MTKTQITESEIQKYGYLSRIYLFKSVESIYTIRCPNELPDFCPDDSGLLLSIPKSESLRQHISSKSFYGWFKVDVILTNPDTLLERWIFLHTSDKIKENLELSKLELKHLMYRKFSISLRSIYTLLLSLPTYSFINQTKQIPSFDRRITVLCDQFHPLPANISSFPSNSVKKIDFIPIQTPVGKTITICQYRTDLEKELPSIFPKNNIFSSKSTESSQYTLSSIEIIEEIEDDKINNFFHESNISVGSFKPSPFGSEFVN